MKRSDKNYMKVYYQKNKNILLEKKRINYQNHKNDKSSSFYIEKRKQQNKKYYYKRKHEKDVLNKFHISKGNYIIYFD